MAEREYYDYEDWLRSGGDLDYGQAVNYQQPYASPYPPMSTPWTPGLVADLADTEDDLGPVGGVPPSSGVPPATGQPGGKTPQQIEAEGRESDRQRGLVGGYMNGNVWVNGSPSSTSGPAARNDSGGYGAGGYDPSGFQWPTFNAQRYTQGPGFSFEKFTPRDPSAVFDDPSYKMRRDEGLQAIEHGAAAKGLTRLPSTLKALGSWNQDFASREAGNIFDRDAQTYGINYGVARDTWDRGEAQKLNAFDRNYGASRDEFDFNQWKPSALTFEDMRARYLAELDATTRLAGGLD